MKKLKLKSKIFCCALCLSLGAGMIPSLSLPKTYAYTPTSSIISSGEFDTTMTKFPASSSDWSSATGSISNSKLKSGIISTNTDNFTANQKEYGLGALPNSVTNPNNYVYMINSGTASTRAGISSKEFTLDANSHYIISVDVATSLPVYENAVTTEIESIASVYLSGGDINESFTAINTNKTWKTYNFYITTNSFESTSVKLEMWLGVKNLKSSVGAVLFDNAKAIKYDNKEFYTRVNSISFTSETNKFTDYSLSTTDLITNANFEDATLSGWTKTNANYNMSKVFTGITPLDNSFDREKVGVDNPGTDLVYNNTKALFINNTDVAGVAYTSDKFTIKRQTYYKISMYVKTVNIVDGGATISIVPENEDLSAVTFSSIKTTTSTNSITNDWTKYTFYVLGSPFGDENVSLKLALGDETVDITEEDFEDKLVKGAVFFDDIQVYELNYNQYTSASEDSYNKKVKLFTDGTASAITNAFFNFADSNYEGTYPLSPASWTINNDNTLSGIISTNKEHFNANKSKYGDLDLGDIGFTRLQKDTSDNADNNVLMIRNTNPDFTTYTSASYSMSDNTYYKLTIDAKTLTTGKAYIKVASGNTTLATFNISSEEDWTTYTVFFNNVFGSKNITVTLGLGTESEKASGYTFFDNIIITSSTADDFEDATTSEQLKKIDFSKETFSLLSTEKDGIYTRPSNWSIDSNNSLINAGVLEGTTNKLAISSVDTDTDVKFTSNFTYTLDTSKFYTLKIKVYGEGLENLEESGVTFGVDENNKFTNLTPTEESEYIFYISGAKLSSITPYFGLVAKDATSAVNAYLTSFELESITEVDFTNMQESIKADDDNTPDNVILIGETTEEDDEDDNNNNNVNYGNNFDWVLIPSLIIGLALIIAIVGVIMRRAKFKKVSGGRKKVANYDRTKTLHPEIVRREAEEARKAKLQAIEEQLLKNREELEKCEAEYKQKRDLAIAQKQEKKAQAEFKAYAKGRNKLAKQQEKLLEEKEIISSDEYLQETEQRILTDYESGKTAVADEELNDIQTTTENTDTIETQNEEQIEEENKVEEVEEVKETTNTQDEVEITEPDVDKKN